MLVLLCLLGIFLCAFTFSCDDDDDDSSSDGVDGDDFSDDDDDDDDVIGDDDDDTTGQFKVISEYIIVDAPPAPPNPATGAETPDEFNKVGLLRYRQDTGDDPPRPVKGIFLISLGWGAGAAQVAILGEDLVELSQGQVEVWGIDRRSNFFEDNWGMDRAEMAKDPQIAYDYYYDLLPVEGKTFQGFWDGKEPGMDMMSEWGVDVTFADIRAIIELVPEANRATNIFYGGHSQGGRTVKMFSAYEFGDGTLGCEHIAGMIFWDVLDQQRFDGMTEDYYLGFLDRLRTGQISRYQSQDLFWGGESSVYMMQYLVMAAQEGYGNGDPRFGPNGFLNSYPGIIGVIEPLMVRFRDITMTNEAFVGLFIDDQSGLSKEFNAHVGQMTGGPVGSDILGVYPKDPNSVYTWLEYDESNPEEFVDLQRVLKMTHEGPTNFCDTYNSSRLLTENWVNSDIETTGHWSHDYFHFYTSRIDVPVFALEGKLLEGTGAYEQYRDKLPPVRGQSQPRDEVGFTIVQAHDWSHMEVLMIQPDKNHVYPRLLDWVYEWSGGTEVQVPKL